MTPGQSDPGARVERVGMTEAEKDDNSMPETLTGDGAAPVVPTSENAAKAESPRPVHGIKVLEQLRCKFNVSRGFLTRSIAVVPRRRLPPSVLPALRSRHHHCSHHPARHRWDLRPRRPCPMA
jgi:hypothetical protein